MVNAAAVGKIIMIKVKKSFISILLIGDFFNFINYKLSLIAIITKRRRKNE